MAHEDEELELDEVARRFETVKAHEIREPDSISLTSSRSKSPELDDIKIIDPAKYTDTLDFQYVDFVKRTKPEESPTFRETVSIIQTYFFFRFWSLQILAGSHDDLCAEPIELNPSGN